VFSDKQVADLTGLFRKAIQKALQPMIKRQEVRYVKQARYGKPRNHPYAIRAYAERYRL